MLPVWCGANVGIILLRYHAISKLLRCVRLCVDTIVETRETYTRFVDRGVFMQSECPLPHEAILDWVLQLESDIDLSSRKQCKLDVIQSFNRTANRN